MYFLMYFLIFFITFFIVISIYFFFRIQWRYKGSNDPNAFEVSSTDSLYQYSEEFKKLKKQTVSITNSSKISLDAFLLTQPNNKKDFVIVLHGYHSNKERMNPWTTLFYELGYNVLTPDNRAHGSSKGYVIGLGWTDQFDYLQWINALINNFGDSINITLFGISMGGSTVLNMTGLQELPPQVTHIISDSPFSNLYDEIKYQLRSYYSMLFLPFVVGSSFISKCIMGFSYKQNSPIDSIKNTTIPILLIHGYRDTFIPYTMSQKLKDTNSEHIILWLTENSDHVQSFSKHTEEYYKRIKLFLSN